MNAMERTTYRGRWVRRRGRSTNPEWIRSAHPIRPGRQRISPQIDSIPLFLSEPGQPDPRNLRLWR